MAHDGLVQLPTSKASACAVLACMDAVLAGTQLGSNAHVVRNPGGRATDAAIHSLILAYRLLGARSWYVVQHSGCGMALSEDLESQRPLAMTLSDRRGSDTTSSMSSNQTPSQLVAADIARIRQHPHVPRALTLRGFVYDPEAQRFFEVTPAHS